MKLTKRIVPSILVFVFLCSCLFAEVKNPDKPLKGDWDFKLKKIWEIDRVGDGVLARPTHLMANDEGTVYLYDRKNREYYMFAKEGKYIKTFAPAGEGPGELADFYDAYLFKDKLLVISFYNIHYFTQEGNFIRFAKHNINHRYPRYFLSEDEYIHYSVARDRSGGLERQVAFYNLKTQKEKTLLNYKAYEGGVAWEKGRIISIFHVPGISPSIVVGFDKDKFYYGFNNKYEIKTADYDTGKTLLTFSLERKPTKLTEEDIEEFFEKNKPPRTDLLPSWIKQVTESLPREETLFSRLDIHNKLLYVHVSHLDRQPEKQEFDIFSPEGKYLYRASIQAPQGTHIVAGPYPVFFIKNNYLYITFEDVTGEGNVKLVKYAITLPTL